MLLLLRAADDDGIGAEEGGEHAGGNAEIDAGHGLGDAVDVVRAAAQAVIFFVDKDQVQADVVVEVGEDLVGKAIFVVELE